MLSPARLIRQSIFPASLGLIILLSSASPVLAADTIPPTTDLILSGIKGNDDWYVTSVDVNMRAFDLESSPASTSYQINSESPIINTFETLDNAIINPSFEDGWVAGINNWQPYPSPDPNLYQASISVLDYRSAAIQNSGNNYHYWTNYDNYVPVVAGRSYTVSAWMRAFNVQTAPGGWFEVWALDGSGLNSDLKLVESMRVTGELDWTLESVGFTVPANYDGVYLKLGAQSGDSGIVWYDGVSMYTGADSLTQFTMVQNGQNSLQYFSVDNQGNSETVKTESPIKIDTVQPEDWDDFGWTTQGNNHTYVGWVSVQDVASGIVPASAQYRWYDDSNCNCWSSWMAVDTVTRLDNGAPATNGYTGLVVVKAPPTDMGNSSVNTKPKMQFRINDVASSLATSPVYSLFGPWLKIVNGGDIFANGGIDGLGPLPLNEFTSHGVIVGGSSLYNVKSLYDWLVAPYTFNFPTSPTLADFLPQYDQIRGGAVPLPSNRLPSATGVYYYSGNYTIDQNSLTSGFTGSQYSAIVIIEGNLNINRDFNLHANTSVVFLVTGSVIYASSTSQSAGYIIAAGNINTNASSGNGNNGNSLTHRGGLAAGEDLIFGRDLGKNKNDSPSEIIDFPVKYLVDPVLASLFNKQDSNFKWQEID